MIGHAPSCTCAECTTRHGVVAGRAPAPTPASECDHMGEGVAVLDCVAHDDGARTTLEACPCGARIARYYSREPGAPVTMAQRVLQDGTGVAPALGPPSEGWRDVWRDADNTAGAMLDPGVTLPLTCNHAGSVAYASIAVTAESGATAHEVCPCGAEVQRCYTLDAKGMLVMTYQRVTKEGAFATELPTDLGAPAQVLAAFERWHMEQGERRARESMSPAALYESIARLEHAVVDLIDTAASDHDYDPDPTIKACRTCHEARARLNAFRDSVRGASASSAEPR